MIDPKSSIEATLRADVIAQILKLEDPGDHVGVVDLDRRTTHVRRNTEYSPDYTFPIFTIDDGHQSQELYPLPLPEPRFFRCEKCSSEARVILSQRNIENPLAPIHPRCPDHLSPGCAKSIDARGDA